MESLAHMIVAATDLVESEGRLLKQNLLRTVIAVVAALLSIVLAFVGVGFFLYGLFLWISQYLTAPITAILFGLITVGLSTGLLWTARRLTR